MPHSVRKANISRRVASDEIDKDLVKIPVYEIEKRLFS
jgi:hypothetical protein